MSRGILPIGSRSSQNLRKEVCMPAHPYIPQAPQLGCVLVACVGTLVMLLTCILQQRQNWTLLYAEGTQIAVSWQPPWQPAGSPHGNQQAVPIAAPMGTSRQPPWQPPWQPAGSPHCSPHGNQQAAPIAAPMGISKQPPWQPPSCMQTCQ